MRSPVRPLYVGLIVLGVAGCAPDAWKASTPFDNWLTSVRAACNYQMIGRYEVGGLLGLNVTDQAIIFVDQTSRLYSGLISPDQWTLTVTSELLGRPSDPGVSCVLSQLPKR